MAVDLGPLDQALETAHLPALSAAMVHLTGDPSWLRPEWRPAYTPLSRGETGVPEAEQAKMRELAKAAITDYLTGKVPMAPTPSADMVRQMMSFVAGADIPDGYGEFLTDELALDGHSSKDPNWSPELKTVARRLHVLVIGAGMSGLLTALRLEQAGVPFQVVEKNADVGGTWLENTYPGCRVDSSNNMY